MNGRRLLTSLALLCALQAPVHAQLPDRPKLNSVQRLMADEAEFMPGPGTITSVLFGEQIAGQLQTTMIEEHGYPNGGPEEAGRIALFTRNSSGQWARSASIDPPSGVTHLGARMALFNEFSLFQASDGASALFYRRNLGKWKLMQRLSPPAGYHFTDVRLSSGWAFIGAVSANAGAVYVYQVTSAGILKGVQTLRSYSGEATDGFATRVAVFGERVVVSAPGDGNNRGAAYVFERSGALFAKRQKLIAINGATNQGFAKSIGIAEDWIAIGAPNISTPSTDCDFGRISGAIYTFRRINGVWLQQDELLAQGAQSLHHECISQLGNDLVIGGNWLVSTVSFDSEAGNTDEALVYVKSGGHYVPSAWAEPFDSPQLAFNLAGSTLFIGASVERGCIFEACIGAAAVFDLNAAVP